MAQFGTATQQHDVCPAVPKVAVRGEAEGGVVGGAGVGTHHDVGETPRQLPPVLLVNGCGWEGIMCEDSNLCQQFLLLIYQVYSGMSE